MAAAKLQSRGFKTAIRKPVGDVTVGCHLVLTWVVSKGTWLHMVRNELSMQETRGYKSITRLLNINIHTTDNRRCSDHLQKLTPQPCTEKQTGQCFWLDTRSSVETDVSVTDHTVERTLHEVNLYRRHPGRKSLLKKRHTKVQDSTNPKHMKSRLRNSGSPFFCSDET